MNRSQYILIVLLAVMLITTDGIGQEKGLDVEESAEVFLEEYSDSFQENFFEALKQKGIENYDKAINLFLECKLIDADNPVVDHELAKVYLVDKQYLKAQEFAIEALLSEPVNLWYLNTLVNITQKQGGTVDDLKARIPYDNTKLKENLALIYYRQANFNGALEQLKKIEKNSFTTDLTSKINNSIKKKESLKRQVLSRKIEEVKVNPIEGLKAKLTNFINSNAIDSLTTLSEEALENYPSQPYFYYANGHALNKTAKPKEAIEILEAALDYMLDDVTLQNKIYKELVDAYTALNNPSKANMYLRMIKPGF